MKERPFGLICIALIIFFWNCFVTLGEERDERERQTFVVRYKNGDQTIPVTVVLDYKKQTEYVINMNNRSPAKSVTLYDFKQRTIAYKDLTNRECFLGSLTYETLNEESEALQYIKNPVDAQPIAVLSLDPGRLAMTPTEIRNIAGQKTAIFCRKMTTWMLLKPNNQTHGLHKRDVGDEEEVEERTYGHHGYHTVRFSHYGHETRRRYRKRTEEPSKLDAQLGHRETSASFQPTHNRTAHSWKYPGHHGLNAPDDHLQNFESHLSSNFSPSIKKQEIRYPFSVRNTIPFSHHHESNESASNYSEKDNFNDLSHHTTVSDHSGHASRTERETTPIDILPHHFPLHSNYSLEAKLLPLYRPDETGIKYDSSDFHGEIESNVLPLDYSHNYYPYHNSGPLDLESYSSSVNDKDVFRKEVQNNKDLYTTVSPDFSNSVLEVPKITEKFESLHQQEPSEFESRENQSPNIERFYSNEVVNPISSKSKLSNSESNQKEDQFQVSDNYLLKSTEQLNEKNNLLNKNNAVIFSEIHDSFTLPATTEAIFEEHTVENFELIKDRQPNENEYKLSAKNLDTFKSQENLPSQKPRTNPFAFRNTVNPKGKDLIFTEKGTLRFQNVHIGTNRTTADSYNIFSTTTQPFLTSTISHDIALHHHAKFRNVLKLLKPDEIIIDVGGIPTQFPSEITESFNHRRAFPGTNTRQSAVKIPELLFRRAPTETTQPQETAQLLLQIAPTTLSPFLQRNRNPPRSTDRSGQASGSLRRTSYDRNTALLSGASNHQNRNHKEAGGLNSASSKFSHGRRNSSFQYAQSHGSTQRRIHPQPSKIVSQPHRSFPYQLRSQQGQLNAFPPGVSMHPRHPQAPYADMVRSNVLHSVPDEQRFRHDRPHRQRHHRRKDRILNPCCKKAENSPNSPSCCRGRGSACCSTSRSKTHAGASCCSSAKSFSNKQAIPANSNRMPIRRSGVSDDSSRNYVDNRDRCQIEKMCRTLYQSTQQVMVCRNAEVNGC